MAHLRGGDRLLRLVRRLSAVVLAARGGHESRHETEQSKLPTEVQMDITGAKNEGEGVEADAGRRDLVRGVSE